MVRTQTTWISIVSEPKYLTIIDRPCRRLNSFQQYNSRSPRRKSVLDGFRTPTATNCDGPSSAANSNRKEFSVGLLHHQPDGREFLAQHRTKGVMLTKRQSDDDILVRTKQEAKLEYSRSVLSFNRLIHLTVSSDLSNLRSTMHNASLSRSS